MKHPKASNMSSCYLGLNGQIEGYLLDFSKTQVGHLTVAMGFLSGIEATVRNKYPDPSFPMHSSVCQFVPVAKSYKNHGARKLR